MSGAFICNALDLPFSGVMKYAKNIHVPAYRKGGGGVIHGTSLHVGDDTDLGV